MGLLTFALNMTLDGCCDPGEVDADDEMLRYWTRVMEAAGAMLFGRRTYELMEDAWPQVARDPKATRADCWWVAHNSRPSFSAWISWTNIASWSTPWWRGTARTCFLACSHRKAWISWPRQGSSQASWPALPAALTSG